MLDFLHYIFYNVFVVQKGGVEITKKKIGRPKSENPKSTPVQIRLDKVTSEILDSYTRQEKVTKSEAIRRGIHRLKDDIKK